VGNERELPPIRRIKWTHGVNGQVARTRNTIIVADVDNPPPGVVKPLRSGSNIKTLVVAPILLKDRYYGNLALTDEVANRFKEADVKLIEGLANQIAITIHRLEVLEGKKEAEQQARNMELFSEIGQSTYELSHRLGNELGLVTTYVNNIREELKQKETNTVQINEELQRVLHDVSSVLKMSKALKKKVAGLGHEGRLEQEPDNIPAKVILEEAELAFPPIPTNIALEWDLADDLATVNVAPGQISDIIFNLIVNAIDAMPGGGKITIRAFNVAPYVQVEVADTGQGITKPQEPKVFNLFYSTKKGSGFGLWSARRYAIANGGYLKLGSSTGQGATFILGLPMSDR
jgi:signal transduction histidine kinase